jgi:hypothetical protein
MRMLVPTNRQLGYPSKASGAGPRELATDEAQGCPRSRRAGPLPCVSRACNAHVAGIALICVAQALSGSTRLLQAHLASL